MYGWIKLQPHSFQCKHLCSGPLVSFLSLKSLQLCIQYLYTVKTFELSGVRLQPDRAMLVVVSLTASNSITHYIIL